MPLYEYECARDGKRFEVIQKFSDEPLTNCPECGGEVKRLLSAPAIQFKGEGWYVNDYGKGGVKPPSGDKAESSEKKTESKSESKPAESKPAAKSD